jgi:hypothetical protein
MSKNHSSFRKFIDENWISIDSWLNEIEYEDHPVFDNRYSKDTKHKRFKVYRKLARLLKIKDHFTNRSVLHVGAATGAYNFVLRYANPNKLIVLEPNNDNFNFLKKSNNICYDDYIQARLEDLSYLNRNDYDLVFLGNLPVSDWCEVIKLLTQLPHVSDIVIESLLCNIEYPHTKFFVNPEINYENKAMDRYYLWDGKLDMEYWSIGEIIRVAAENGFTIMYKHYISKNTPIGWCDLIFSRIDKPANV